VSRARRLALACALAGLVALALLPAGARAAWFPADAVDGPSPDIVGLGGVDLARDGTGAMVWLKRVDGIPHVFLSRLAGGVWSAPARIDAGVPEAAAQPVVAAADGGRLAVLWTSAGRVLGVLAPPGESPQPVGAPAVLFSGAAISGLAADMGVSGVAYAAFTVTPGTGGSGGDVRALHERDGVWALAPDPVDVVPTADAGTGSQRARVAVAADGNAVVTWGEDARVLARRLVGTTPSLAPQQVSVDALAGAPGGAADAPAIVVEADPSFAWIAFRQLLGGVPRTVARRLVGSAFEAPVLVDGGSTGGPAALAMNINGQGVAVAPSGPGAVADVLGLDNAFGAPVPLGGTLGGLPEVAATASERREVATAWSADGQVWGRFQPVDAAGFDPVVGLSRPEFGGALPGSLVAAGDRTSDSVVGFVTDDPAVGRRVVAAVFDRPAGRPYVPTKRSWQRTTRPRISWSPGIDLWGPVRFDVTIDGALAGSTHGAALRPATPLPEGPHVVTVTAVDLRGQRTPSLPRTYRLDAAPPRVSVAFVGKKRAKAGVSVRVRAVDAGSGVGTVRVDYGDRTTPGRKLRATHRWARRGRYTVAVRVADRAGNVARTSVRIRIAK
jgi:hypothetical protein